MLFEPCLRCWLKRKGDLYRCRELPSDHIPMKHDEGCEGDTGSVQATLDRLDALREEALLEGEGEAG